MHVGLQKKSINADEPEVLPRQPLVVFGGNLNATRYQVEIMHPIAIPIHDSKELGMTVLLQQQRIKVFLHDLQSRQISILCEL